MTKRTILKYCTGCGLCTQNDCLITETATSFDKPDINLINKHFCIKTCPMFINLNDYYSSMSKNIFGNYLRILCGWSTNNKIRNKASSGGSITSLCCYLLDNHIVDAVIHVCSDPHEPWKTVVVSSSDSEELLLGCGSRYAQSSMLHNIDKLLSEGKTYAFVGKPCDVYSLNQYLKINKEYKKQIKITISFFCAGQPSENANKKMIKELIGSENFEDIDSLDYRGNGWPGKTRIIDKKGQKYEMDYEESWGNILGRDIRIACRYCMIGTGETSDISFGDAWYLKEGKPSFDEADGRNVIITRTSIGDNIISACEKQNYIYLDRDIDENELSLMQPSQVDRKATMYYKILATRIMLKSSPRYSNKVLHTLSKGYSSQRKEQVFKGTIGRIIKKKM